MKETNRILYGHSFGICRLCLSLYICSVYVYFYFNLFYYVLCCICLSGWGNGVTFVDIFEPLLPGPSPWRPDWFARKGLVLGAVKTNIAHLEGAAGITSFVKSAFVIQHKKLPPNLHFSTLNLLIDLEDFDYIRNIQKYTKYTKDIKYK